MAMERRKISPWLGWLLFLSALSSGEGFSGSRSGSISDSVSHSDSEAYFPKLTTSPSNKRIRSNNNNSNNRRANPNRVKKWNKRPSDAKFDKKKGILAESVERRLLDSVLSKTSGTPTPFPSVRECNSALATFGDNGELLRALRLFVKMRKAGVLANSRNGRSHRPPTPNIMTYSTLMSRAVKMGKAVVALRLWRLMKSHPDLSFDAIVPDVKAANTLMNVYAKLADHAAARDLLAQMLTGDGPDVPKLTPNIVTYNTLMDACHRAGELTAALSVLESMKSASIKPDARTYTSLISTVARKPSKEYGVNDPDMAFALLDGMIRQDVHPNGMTYCALIDVCSRCRRPDLALKGLRMMLRQNIQRVSARSENQVGAWTAAINACGKAGRYDTAIRLFRSMPNFGVVANTVTCGCLTDCLLKGGRVTDTLEVLRYMKEQYIEPTEIMYTSLISSAGRLVKIENKLPLVSINYDEGAIQVYTELMGSLMKHSGENSVINYNTSPPTQQEFSNTLLLKVFLVYQEMKAAGAILDLACYNALLTACKRAGDMLRSRDVFTRIIHDGLIPNDITWREMLQAASVAKSSQDAQEIWAMALDFKDSTTTHAHVRSSSSTDDVVNSTKAGGTTASTTGWKPNADAFQALISSYARHASIMDTEELKETMFRKIISLYDCLLRKDTHHADIQEIKGLNHIDLDEVQQNTKSMLLILRAAVIVELFDVKYAKKDTTAAGDKKYSLARTIAKDVANFECFKGRLPPGVCDVQSAKALQLARTWARE